jgi:hypothetical protein
MAGNTGWFKQRRKQRSFENPVEREHGQKQDRRHDPVSTGLPGNKRSQVFTGSLITRVSR